MLLNLWKNALLSCRSATKFVVKSKFVTPTAERKMKEATLREQTIQLILPTNWTLFRDSINEQDKCHRFGERQTLTHLFVTCSEAHYFGLFLLIGGTPKTEIRSLSIKITVGTSNLVPTRSSKIIKNLVPRAHVSFAFKVWYCCFFQSQISSFLFFQCVLNAFVERIHIDWTPCKPRNACAVKPELLKSWTLEIDYSRTSCLGADQKARGLCEQDWGTSPGN